MTTIKYRSEIHQASRIKQNIYNPIWNDYWFCREFAQRDINAIVILDRYATIPLVTRLMGTNMRSRTLIEQEGMGKFASLLLPNNPIDVDDRSIWITSEMDVITERQIYLPQEIYSMLFYYIKYLSIQMQNRVSFNSVCKSLIKRRHSVFDNIPEQQLGTALYFYSYVRYPKKMYAHRRLLSNGNGPGTAMKKLSNLDEAKTEPRSPAAEFYWTVLDEWCSLFKEELRYIVNYHVKEYKRFWYLPLLIQDVYANIYDGDGKYDNEEYSEDEW